MTDISKLNPPPQSNFSVLESLGIVGWNHLEPAILAAIVTEKPLLLIGSHGTAKSLVLERLAAALGVSFRHYNASILNFDDLVGFPSPDLQNKSVQYLRSGMDAWDVEAIFVDEISRCRPDMQNRLFPLIYDRKLQGVSLPKLRFCWSAMNPPCKDSDPNRYFGSFELDDAFADRYDWIISVPDKLSSSARLAIIEGTESQSESSNNIHQAIGFTKGRMNLVREVYGRNLALFFDGLYTILQRYKYSISFRRMKMLYENSIALIATGYYASVSDALYRTVLYGLPHRTNQSISSKKIQQVVSTALQIQGIGIDDIRRKLLEEVDPVKRIIYALPSKDSNLVTATILDSYASLTESLRMALSAKLFPILVELFPDVPAIVLVQLADDMEKIHALGTQERLVYSRSNEYGLAQRITAESVQLYKSQVWMEDVFWVCFNEGWLGNDHDFEQLVEFCKSIDGTLNSFVRSCSEESAV